MTLSNLQLNPQFVQAVRDAVDVVEIASGYTKLARAGRKWKGLCPLHKEKTPSFNIDAELGFFKCFGCGAGGDAIKLHMLLSGDDFAAAMEALATRFGVPLPAPAAGHRGGRARVESEHSPEEILEAAASWFRGELVRSELARSYLERRAIPFALAERFGLGYAPDGWRYLVAQLAGRFSVGDLLAVGLLVRPDGGGEPYDRFRNRLVFPIRNAAGRLVGFGGRTLGDDAAKYVNSPESEQFRKGALLYALDLAKRSLRETRRALLVEGYLDVVGAVAAGIDNAVASMGTALTDDQARLLARYSDEVVLGYDADEAGAAACRRALPILLGHGLTVRRVRLPEGDDPDSLRAREGPTALRTAVDEADDLLLSELERAVPADLHRNPRGRARASQEVAELLRAIPDAIVRYGYARLAADRLGVPADLVWRRLGAGKEALAEALGEPERRAGAHGRERQAMRVLFQRLVRGEPLALPERLPPPDAFRDPALREFFRAFLVLFAERGERASLRDLEARIENLADPSTAMADLLIESEDSSPPGELSEALRDLRLRWARERRNELVRLLGSAETSGDHAQFERLLAEKKGLEIELFPTAPNAG